MPKIVVVCDDVNQLLLFCRNSKQETVGVILKLVSPDYRISHPSAAAPAETDALLVCLVDCIKVSFAVGPVVDILSGNEARLPLEYPDLRQVYVFFVCDT